MKTTEVAAIIAFVSLLGGCVLPKYTMEDGDFSDAGDEKSDWDAPDPPASCNITNGGVMVGIRGGYCIDQTAVTYKNYKAWHDGKPGYSAPPGCESATSKSAYSPPAVAGDGCRDAPTVDAAYENEPVVCIDWCDARAFCIAMGKDLCGAIDGASDWGFTDAYNPQKSQWQNACSSGGRHIFTYGDTYEKGSCNIGNPPSSAKPRATDDASRVKCQSPVPGYSGVFDLIGNVGEWEDSCNDKECRVRGGDFAVAESEGKDRICAFNQKSRALQAKTEIRDFVGFRCCMTPGS
ncbi:MAG: formylglycine-generating enzyme family protein [Polyangiaceae bacterium]|nr:formylglycine-generating enzyme family protein [Polyangiaceae bacterium]